jgi:nitrogen fixation/metabolism regulation signal transduction histidine kinase
MPSLFPKDLQPLFNGFLHEIRNPMSALLTSCALLSEPDLLEKEDFASLVKVVDEETRRMNRVVNEFDRYLHVPPPSKEAVDVAAMVRTIIDELRGGNAVNKKVRLADELPEQWMTFADSAQIGEALTAVLTNAFQALQGGVQVPAALALCPEESTSPLVFLVRDNGEGFTAESAARAFEPFYSSRSGATGLGLPLARTLLQNNGGDLEIVPSKEGAGATLRVTLPGETVKRKKQTATK